MQITVNIGTEITDSTKLLSGMVSSADLGARVGGADLSLGQNDTFDTTGGFLGGTVRKMNKMAKRQGGQFCYCASRRSQLGTDEG